MADGIGPGRFTLSGILLAALLVILILASLYLFIAQPYWFPTLASVHGQRIDSLFMAVLVVSGIAFVLVQGALGFFVARYGENGRERAAYWHDNPRAEAFLLIGTAVILTILVFMGQRVWASIYFVDAPADALVVQVTGEQFQWNFHYAGPDDVLRCHQPARSEYGLGAVQKSPATETGNPSTLPGPHHDGPLPVGAGERYLGDRVPVTQDHRTQWVY